jgi:hypothetical protein
MKPSAPKCFCEYVTQLQLGADELDVDQLPVAALPDEVKLHVNMLAPVVVHRVLH